MSTSLPPKNPFSGHSITPQYLNNAQSLPPMASGLQQWINHSSSYSTQLDEKMVKEALERLATQYEKFAMFGEPMLVAQERPVDLKARIRRLEEELAILKEENYKLKSNELYTENMMKQIDEYLSAQKFPQAIKVPLPAKPTQDHGYNGRALGL